MESNKWELQSLLLAHAVENLPQRVQSIETDAARDFGLRCSSLFVWFLEAEAAHAVRSPGAGAGGGTEKKMDTIETAVVDAMP